MLRVCSKRNANSHFAAIEAELLRLDWDSAMDALVPDWTRQNRADDFLELESNVRSYVDNNAVDLTNICKEYRREWEREGRVLKLADHLRCRHFPYERIITHLVNNAVTGKVVLSPPQLRRMEGNADKTALAEIHERITALSKTGTLLDAMTPLNLEDDKASAVNEGWTAHHTSCSNSHRCVLSGWFLLYHRLREANDKILTGAAGADGVLEATMTREVHPEREIRTWAEKWLALCAPGGENAKVERKNGEGTALLGGILPTDKLILTGVVKVLSLSKDEKSQRQSMELDQRVKEIFPE